MYNMRSKCQRCKNESPAPHPPLIASLSAARLGAFERPFTYIGIDFFGPLHVAVGRRNEKRWFVVFTCVTDRFVLKSPTADTPVHASSAFKIL